VSTYEDEALEFEEIINGDSVLVRNSNRCIIIIVVILLLLLVPQPCVGFGLP
jgi:hypothetical protein